MPPIEPDTSLRDRVILITGGSRGLGRVMADALVEAGCRVMISASREPEALVEAERYTEMRAGPGRLKGMRADVSAPTDCEELVTRTIEIFGRIDMLVNNAGRGMSQANPDVHLAKGGRFWETPVEVWKSMIETNLNGVFFMTRAATPHMVLQGFGRIVNVSTSWATMIRSGYSPYGPAKAAIEVASSVWAKDLAGSGVTCNVLLPGGATDTRMIPGTGSDRVTYDGKPLLRPEIMRAPILWLASDRSSKWTSRRINACNWDISLHPDEAAERAATPVHPIPAII